MTRERLLGALWWVMVFLSAAALVFASPLNPELQNPLFAIPVASSAIVGAILARRRPDNPVGWVFLGVGALSGILVVAVVVATWGASASGAIPWWGVVAAWVSGWAWYPLLYLMTIPTLLLFPSGLLSPRWRIALWVPIAALLCATAIVATAPFIVVEYDDSGSIVSEVANPLSPGFMAGFDAPEGTGLFQFLMLFYVAGLLAAIVSTGLRFKRARGVERLQMRWFGLSVAMFVPLIGLEARFGDSGLTWMLVVEAVVVAAVPVSCGVAILRYRLYEIDRIISRTTSYALVTALVVGLYLGVVAAASAVLPVSDTLPVALATLVAAAVFRPALRWTQKVVDRRFDRTRYDAETTVQGFSQRLAREVDTGVVTDELLEVLGKTVQPSSVGLWVAGGRS